MRSCLILASTLLVAPVLAACGGDGGAKPDAFIVHADAPIDNPPPPPGCSYGELRDTTNDDDGVTAGNAPEDTMVMHSSATVLCGSFNIARYEAGTQKVDADAYTFNLPAAGTLYMQLYGTGLDALSEVRFAVYGGSAFDTLQMSGVFQGDHAAMSVPLESGTYEVYIQAFNATAPASDVGYKVKITADTTTTNCALLTTGGYAEARDAATTNLGNDMIVVDLDANGPEFTTSTADQPEPTALTIDATGSSRFSGNADITTAATATTYIDRDTFEIKTGAATHEISIRTAWATATADLDVVVFEKPAPTDMTPFELSTSAATGMGPSEELNTIAVKPNTSYWVWIGNWNGSTTVAPYAATICGRGYTPPAN